MSNGKEKHMKVTAHNGNGTKNLWSDIHGNGVNIEIKLSGS
jgi:hypothetical protein